MSKLALANRVPREYDAATFQDIVRLLEQQANKHAEGSITARHAAMTAAPTLGTWVRGDTVDNSAPSLVTPSGGSYVLMGWICTVSGTPGTWKERRVSTGTPGIATVQVFTSGSGTYTTPANCSWIEVELVGAGGGSCGSGTGPGAGGNGGNTTFSTLTGGGGTGGGTAVTPSAGGTAAGGDVNVPGAPGGGATDLAKSYGASGGGTPFAGSTPGGSQGVGVAPPTNSGAGAGGAGNTGTGISGGGGAAGGYVSKVITSPAATYSYGVGAAGSAGTAGTSGNVGQAGAAGLIVVTEHYN